MIFKKYPFTKKDIKDSFDDILTPEEISSYFKGLKLGYKEEETIVGTTDFYFRDGASDGASIDKENKNSWKKVIEFRRQRIEFEKFGTRPRKIEEN